MVRWAIVKGCDLATLRAYLPHNYRVVGSGDGKYLISGTDVAGWTLEGYVVPRLASGLIAAMVLEPIEGESSDG